MQASAHGSTPTPSDGTREQLRAGSAKGAKVLQLVYDPTVAPAMLYVLTDAGLTVLREE